MTLFPELPPLTDKQRRDHGFSSAAKFREWIAVPRTPVELKRAIIVEAGRPPTRHDILPRLLTALMKAERLRIERGIAKQRTKTPRL